jgi:hypothetical protein
MGPGRAEPIGRRAAALNADCKSGARTARLAEAISVWADDDVADLDEGSQGAPSAGRQEQTSAEKIRRRRDLSFRLVAFFRGLKFALRMRPPAISFPEQELFGEDAFSSGRRYSPNPPKSPTTRQGKDRLLVSLSSFAVSLSPRLNESSMIAKMPIDRSA